VRPPEDAPDHDGAALEELRQHFYGGDLAAAASAGERLLSSTDPHDGDPVVQGRRAVVLLWLTRCARRADTLDVALEHAYQGVAAARAARDSRLTCQLQAQYVHVLASLGQNEGALEEGYEVLRQAVDGGDTLAQAACWLALGQVHWTMHQWTSGEEAYTEALRLGRLSGDCEVSGLASNGIAAMEDHKATEARAAGRIDEAEACSRRSLALLVDFTDSSLMIGDSYNAWIGTHNQACCLLAMGDHHTARAMLEQQLALLDEEHGSRHNLIFQVLGDIHLAEGRYDAAIACYTEAVQIAESLQVPLLAMDASRGLVDALEGKGNHRAALEQHRRYHELYVRLASIKAQAQARALAVMYETEKTLALAETLQRRADQLASVNSSLVAERVVLRRDSLQDALTGLANRRHFDRVLANRTHQEISPLGFALAMIDVDRFKRINDRFSHLTGDEVLRRLGALLQLHARQLDLPARYGGEEFALILVDVDRSTARHVCERLREAIESEPWSALHADLRVTVSIGVVHAHEAVGETDALLSMADERLYAAKRNGRNRVVDSLG
jgi:diguanylate cyclase (GGDEF)-like protein